MNDAEIVIEVRRILDQRQPAEQTIRAIKALVSPPKPKTPVELTARRWPVLHPSAPPGTAWERHDDPELNR
jgi:hypothetical protein